MPAVSGVTRRQPCQSRARTVAIPAAEEPNRRQQDGEAEDRAHDRGAGVVGALIANQDRRGARRRRAARCRRWRARWRCARCGSGRRGRCARTQAGRRRRECARTPRGARWERARRLTTDSSTCDRRPSWPAERFPGQRCRRAWSPRRRRCSRYLPCERLSRWLCHVALAFRVDGLISWLRRYGRGVGTSSAAPLDVPQR